MSEHPCTPPKAKLDQIGLLYLCTCGRLYVARETWADPVYPTKIAVWRQVTQRRWWRRK